MSFEPPSFDQNPAPAPSHAPSRLGFSKIVMPDRIAVASSGVAKTGIEAALVGSGVAEAVTQGTRSAAKGTSSVLLQALKFPLRMLAKG